MTIPRVPLAVLLVCIAFASSGCPVVHRGETRLKWTQGQSGSLLYEAHKDGEYALYSIGDAKPRIVLTLKSGDPLGFEKGGDGKTVTAIAGEHRLSFPEDTYYWNYRGKR